MAFVLVRYWGIEGGSWERDLEGGEGDESMAIGVLMMGLQRRSGESNDGEGTEVSEVLASMGSSGDKEAAPTRE